MKSALFACATVLSALVSADAYQDHWLRGINVDPDYMHHKAMQVKSKAAVLNEKIKHDHISAKLIEFDFDLKDEIIRTQRFLYGFVNGTAGLKSNPVCTDAINLTIDSAFKVLNYRFVWLPEYSIKFQQQTSKTQEYANTAFVYCKMDALITSFAELFNPDSGASRGRLLSRVATSLSYNWWYQTNCVVDGFLGNNFYDVGFCSGNLFSTVFDVTLG